MTFERIFHKDREICNDSCVYDNIVVRLFVEQLFSCLERGVLKQEGPMCKKIRSLIELISSFCPLSILDNLNLIQK